MNLSVNDRIGLCGLIVGIAACMAAWLTVPQVQGLISSVAGVSEKPAGTLPPIPSSTSTPTLQIPPTQTRQVEPTRTREVVTPIPMPTSAIRILQTANYQGHTYHLISSDSWTNSEAFAQTLGGHLATINDEAENQFIYDTFTSNGKVDRGLWIGLNDAAVEGTFVWAGGEPVTFTKFKGGEPNNFGPGEDYIHIFNPSDNRAPFWNDVPDAAAPFETPLFGVVEVVP